MLSFPIFVKLQGKPVLVVGGGEVGFRKIQSMRQAGARVTVVAPYICDQVREMADNAPSDILLIEAEYNAGHIVDHVLVIAATDILEVNEKVKQHAEAMGIWVNVVDEPDLCGFTFPAIIDRSPMTIAISSNGKAPVLARLWKEQLERQFPKWTAKLAQQAGAFREKVKSGISTFQSRRHFWETIFRGPATQYAAQNDWDGVQNELESTFAKYTQNDQTSAPKGHVYLVGGGPGDPELLTIKALQTMQMADVIVYDYLISEPILALCRKDAQMISVGKKAGNHTLPQDQINQLLVDLAQEGKVVCRLKGGDPYIYGRGGEEAQLLAKNGIPYKVIPGITAAAACSASSGIPLTHRDYAQSLQFITGHCKSSDAVASADTNGPHWPSLAVSNQTLVVYMGVIRSATIKDNLIEHGRAPDTPIAIIEKGTRPDQRVVIGQLHELDELAVKHKIGSPALIIIGEVVKLHSELQLTELVEQAEPFTQAA